MAASADTIYALSSGLGKASVAIVRISGSQAQHIIESVAKRLPSPRYATKSAVFVDGGKTKIDEALVLWFPGPASFTGEDCAELHLHGSPGIVRTLLAELGRFSGCRVAEPGEFTRRAVLNDKLDLVSAEGLADMMEAETLIQVEQALFHVDGRASDIFQQWREKLVEAEALIEACIDFSDEEGVSDEAMPRVRRSLEDLQATLKQHLADSQRSQVKREGVHIVLAGAPNVGKSSLLNALSARDVAIVSNEAGTTRDAIEVHLDLDGIPVLLTDTAGIRANIDSHVEQLGIEKTRQRLETADIVMNLASKESDWLEIGVDSHTLRIWNKSDVERYSGSETCDLQISATTGEGISDLIARLTELAHDLTGNREPVLLARARQIRAVEVCIAHIESALNDKKELEVMAEEVRLAGQEIARMIGVIDVEDVLDTIFSRFCIGK